MIEIELLAALSQFGVAGLIGWMWLAERRSASAREHQLSEAHARLMADAVGTEAIIETVRANTRAMVAMESAQRELISLLRQPPGPGPAPSLPVAGR